MSEARPTRLVDAFRFARALVFCSVVAVGCAGDVSLPTAPSSDADFAKKGKGGRTPTDTTVVTPPDTTTTTPTTPTDTVTPPPTGTPSGSPIAGAFFWVNPNSKAKQTADAWRSTRPADALQMDKIAAQPQARWLGNWNTDVRTDVAAAVTTMSASGALPVLVAYNIPQRDCGGLSANSTAPDAYRQWISAFAAGIAGRRAVVILEPDAIAGMGCLTTTDQAVRLDLIRYAVQVLVAQGPVSVYLDGGHARWQSAATMAARLHSAGVASAAGFVLNVSNFIADADNISYGEQLSALIGGKHFVLDTGRNGLGPTADYQWCNPAGRALGRRPTTATGHALVDAVLWIKVVGESDGSCNGAPASGTWMPEYALGLAQRAAY